MSINADDLAEHETVVIFKGKDAERLRELRAEVQMAAASADGPKRQGDANALAEAAAAHDAYLTEATERGIHIEIQPVGRLAFREFVEKHPPRPANEDDAGWGFNYLTLGDDLVPACIVAGQFDSADERRRFLDALSDGQWSRLYSAALELNRNFGPDPKGLLSSRLALISDAT